MNYKEKQANWLKTNKIKKGSLLKVVKTAENGEQDWTNWWTVNMTANIGKTGIVIATTSDGIYIDFDDGKRFQYPFFTLEPNNIEMVASISKGDGDVYLSDNDDTLKSLHIADDNLRDDADGLWFILNSNDETKEHELLNLLCGKKIKISIEIIE